MHCHQHAILGGTPTRAAEARRGRRRACSTRAAAAWPATSASGRPLATSVDGAAPSDGLLPAVRAASERHRRARRRLQLPHPDRAERRARARPRAPPVHLAAGPRDGPAPHAASPRSSGDRSLHDRRKDTDHEHPTVCRPPARPACANGGSSRSSATRATASTASSARLTRADDRRGSCRPATRRWRPSRRSATPSSAAGRRRLHGDVRPGRIHLLNGLYDAKLDHVPVVAIVGQTNRSAMGGSYQQEVDLLSLFKDVASDYVQMVTVPEQLPNVLDRAIRIAMSRPGPDRDHHPLRRAGARVRAARSCVQAGALEPGHLLADGRPRRRRHPPGRRHPQRRLEGRAAGRPGRARRARRGRAGRRPARRRRRRRRCSARTSCPTTCPGSRGRSACSAPGPATR